MNKKTIVAVAAILVVLGAGYVVARPQSGFWSGMMGSFGTGNWMMGNYGYGNGMMGNNGNGNWMMGNYGYGNGMMGNYSYGNGMMGNGVRGGTGCGGPNNAGYGANAAPITIAQAKGDVEQYLASTGNNDLQIAEIMKFDNNFYAGVKEKSTGKYAFEVLVNKYTGAVFPEMGPNMMWNTKYGHMGWNAPATVTKEQAIGIAQGYLDRALPGTKTGDADEFYGYYTIEVTKDSNIYGMLSVNSNTGAVWYHSWHGAFVKIQEV